MEYLKHIHQLKYGQCISKNIPCVHEKCTTCITISRYVLKREEKIKGKTLKEKLNPKKTRRKLIKKHYKTKKHMEGSKTRPCGYVEPSENRFNGPTQ